MNKEEQVNKQKRHWWIFWVSLPLVVIFGASLVFIYLYADEIASKTIKTVVNDRSDGVYSIQYEDISLNLFTGSLIIKEIELFPDSLVNEAYYEEPLYRIGSQSISLNGFSFWHYAVHNVMVLDNLNIDNPSIEIAGGEDTKDDQKQNVDVILRNELSRYFDDLIIGEFRISHAVVDFPQRKDNKIFSGIGSFSIVLKDLQLNEDANPDTSSLFFSDEALIILHDLKYHIDSLAHDLFIDQVEISADDKQINIQNVSLEPAFSDTLRNEYRIKIPNISLLSVNIDSIMENGILAADELLINNPGVAIHLLNEKPDKSSNFFDDSLMLVLPAELSIIKINRLFLQNGVFRFVEDRNEKQNFVELASFSFLSDTIMFDSTLHLRKIEDIFLSGSSLACKNVEVDLELLRHQIRADIVNISPADSRFISSGMLIAARDSTGFFMNGKINEIELYNLDFRSLKMKKTLLASFLVIDSADVAFDFSAIRDKQAGDEEVYMPYFELDTVVLKGSRFKLHYKQEGKDEIAISSNIELTLADFKPDTSLNQGEQAFDLQMAVLSLHEISMGKRRNFNIAIESIDFNSVNQVLIGNNFRQGILNAKDGSPRLVKVEKFRLDGVSMSEFLDKSSGTIKRLLIEKPEIYFDAAGAGSGKKAGEIQQQLAREVLSFLNRLKIGHLDLNKMRLHFGQERLLINRTEIADIYIDLEGIDIHEGTLLDKKPLYADGVRIEVKDFKEFTKDGSAEISFKQLLVNRQKNQLQLNGFKYDPVIENTRGKAGVEFESRLIVLNNFDFDAFYFNNYLITEDLHLYNPFVYYYDPSVEETSGEELKSHSYPAVADFIKLGVVNFENGTLAYGSGRDTLAFDYDLKVKAVDINTKDSFIPGKDPLPLKHFKLDIRNFTSFSSENEHSLTFDNLTYATETDELFASGIRFYPQMNEPLPFLVQHDRKSAASISIPHLSVEAFEFNDLYLNKLIDLQLLEMDELDLTLYVRHLHKNEESASNKSHFPGFLNKLKVGLFRLSDLDLNIYRYAGDSVTKFVLNDVSGRLNNFSMDGKSRIDDEIFKAGDLHLEKANYSFRTADSMYIISADNISLSTGNKTLSFDSFRLIPRYPRFEFSRKLGYQTDRAEVEGQRIYLTGVDFRSFFENSKLFVDEVYLNDFSVSLFRDKRVAFPAWQRSKMPQKMLRELSMPLDINKVNLQNFSIRYSEMANNAKNPGLVFFKNMQGDLTNVTNVPDSVTLNPLMKLSLKGEMLNEGKMNVLLNMHLDSPRDTFSFYGSLSTMQLPVLNSLSRNLFGVAIKQGRGSVDTLMIFGNEEYETGYMIFPYKKFRIQMVDPSTGERGGIGDGLMTFLANNILLKSNNPRVGHSVRVGRIFFKRNPSKSIFNYLWKGIMSGVETTMGYNIREQKKDIKAFKEQMENQQND